MKIRQAILIVFLVPVLFGGLTACGSGDDESIELPQSYERRSVLQKFAQQLRNAYADCSTPNNMPVSLCADWITGPASVHNPAIPMYRWDKTVKTWKPAILHETDGGWPVMSPDGKSLELLAYGDTWVKNPAYTTANRLSDLQNCAKKSVSSICKSDTACQKIFQGISDKMEACAYWLAKRDHRYIGTGLVLTAFDNRNNVVFFDADIDPQSPYRIKFKDHLRDKAVRHNSMENTYGALLKTLFTGVYVTDAFYLCPKAATTCSRADKVLYFVTQTVYWHLHESDVSKLKPVEKYFKLTREGMGFYRFGTLAAKTDKSNGCRIPFATPVPPLSCPSKVADDLHPKDPLFTEPGTQVVQSENPNVLWGWGSRFTLAIVMHDYIDPHHSGASKSQDYVYFLGSGEMSSSIVNGSAQYEPTKNLYMARLPAREDALFKGQFEYYKGTVGGKSLWGAYDQAKPLLNTFLPIFPSSFTLRHGRYYLAASCGLGMCVTSSKDGYIWDLNKAELVSYSDVTGDDASTDFVYGHAWVPAGLYPHASAIPYVFSVWKGRGGYAADFWFKGKPKEPIPLGKRFHFYNTKMYLYWPK